MLPHDWIEALAAADLDNVQECKEAAAGARRLENEEYDGQEKQGAKAISTSKKSNKSIEREQKFLEKVKTAATIVIDLDYDEKMTETEQKSLSQQIMYCYGANKRAKNRSTSFCQS